MTEFSGQVKKTALIISTLIVVCVCIMFGSRKIDGIVLITHSLVCFALGIWIVIKRWKKGRGLLFGSLYIFWALADLGWSLSYFILNLSSRSIAAIALTESFYCLAFLAGCTILITNIEGSKLNFFGNKIALLPLFIASPVALRLIIGPFLSHSDAISTSFFNVGELSAIFSSYLLLFVSLLVMISSRGFAWGRFCSGMACLVFGDWTMRVDKLLGHQAEFGLSSFLVLFGLYFSATALLSNDKTKRISAYNSTSLKSNVKLWMLIVLFGFLGFYCLTQLGSLESLKALSIAVCFGVLIAVFASEALVNQVLRVSEQIGRVFKAEVAEENVQLQASPDTLPLELRDTYEMVFSSSLRELKLKEETRRVEKERKIQRQVAHDIRSPLTALCVANEDLSELPESKRILVRSAVMRIQDIANNLLNFPAGFSGNAKNAPALFSSQNSCQSTLISTLVDSLMSEKRLQYRFRLNLEIVTKFDINAHGIFANIQPTDFKRVLSNIINNAVEAIEETGEVSVSLRASNDGRAIITVKDSGKGISPELLPKLGMEEIVSSKAGGSGLGLAHAKETIENWNGQLVIRSSLGVGTEVDIHLPVSLPPSWFIDHIDLSTYTTVLVLDDDASIHHVWAKRFEGTKKSGIEILHFSSPSQLSAWIDNRPEEKIAPTLYLVDYELIGQNLTGIEIIKKFNIAQNSILVTSRFEEDEVLRQSKELNLRIMPKGMAAFVPVDFLPLNKVDCVLIDDDVLTRQFWEQSAKDLGKHLKAVSSAKDFFKIAPMLDRKIAIYVDSFLGTELSGELVAKDIFEMGFKNIILTTGYSRDNFPTMHWIQDVISKIPPWMNRDEPSTLISKQSTSGDSLYF